MRGEADRDGANGDGVRGDGRPHAHGRRDDGERHERRERHWRRRRMAEWRQTRGCVWNGNGCGSTLADAPTSAKTGMCPLTSYHQTRHSL